jgi:anti-sigma B factor antagonist
VTPPEPAAPPAALLPLTVETVLEGRTTRLAVVGELTYVTAPLFGTQVADVLGPGRAHLVLDMTRVRFCDSIGLSALIGVQQQAALLGGGVALSGVHGSLARSLAVTGADVLFDVVDRGDARDRRNGEVGPSLPDVVGSAGGPT